MSGRLMPSLAVCFGIAGERMTIFFHSFFLVSSMASRTLWQVLGNIWWKHFF